MKSNMSNWQELGYHVTTLRKMARYDSRTVPDEAA